MGREEGRKDALVVARADRFPQPEAVEQLQQAHEARLRDLGVHGAALNGLDFGVGGCLFFWRKGVDVVEDVHGGVLDVQGGAHFGEHVVLRFAWEIGISWLERRVLSGGGG